VFSIIICRGNVICLLLKFGRKFKLNDKNCRGEMIKKNKKKININCRGNYIINDIKKNGWDEKKNE